MRRKMMLALLAIFALLILVEARTRAADGGCMKVNLLVDGPGMGPSNDYRIKGTVCKQE